MFLNLGQSSYAQVKEMQETANQNNNVPSHITVNLSYYKDEGGSYWGLERKSGTGFERGLLFFLKYYFFHFFCSPKIIIVNFLQLDCLMKEITIKFQ